MTWSKQTRLSLGIYFSISNGKYYVTDKGVEKLGEIIIDMSDLTGGIHRGVSVEIYFGKAEMIFTAYEPNSQKKYEAHISLENFEFKKKDPILFQK